jgi:hypothetical protein
MQLNRLNRPKAACVLATTSLAFVIGFISFGLLSDGRRAVAATLSPDAQPVVGSVTPLTLTAGGPDALLTLSSSTFITTPFDPLVTWNSQSLSTTVVDSTTLLATVPATLTAWPGTGLVQIIDPGGVSSNSITVTVITPTVILTSATPATAVAGVSTTLALSGDGFYAGTQFNLNSVSLSATVLSNQQADVILPSGVFTVAGTYSLTALNPDVITNSSAIWFSILPGPVSAIAVSPDPATVSVQTTQTFSASGIDAYGNLIGPITPSSWGVSDLLAGTIDASGFFTAGTTTGAYTVTASDGSVTGTGTLIITAGPSAAISLTAAPPILFTDGISFTVIEATVLDGFGNSVGAGREVTFTPSTGTVTPTVATTDPQGRATTELRYAVTSPTSTLTSTVVVTAETIGVSSTVISNSLTVSGTFSPRSMWLPIMLRAWPLNTSPCLAYNVPVGSSFIQESSQPQVFYSFVATDTTHILRVNNYASTGTLTVFRVVADDCAGSPPSVTLAPITFAAPLVNPPAIFSLPLSGLTVGQRYIVRLDTSAGFSQQNFTFALLP